MLCSNQLSYVATDSRNLEGRKLSLPSPRLSIDLPPIQAATHKKTSANAACATAGLKPIAPDWANSIHCRFTYTSFFWRGYALIDSRQTDSQRTAHGYCIKWRTASIWAGPAQCRGGILGPKVLWRYSSQSANELWANLCRRSLASCSGQ